MKRYRQTKRFTLLEMLVAMAVLVVLAMIMFEIINRAQQAWSSMQANTRIYENARVAFEVIGRDLQSAVATGESNRQIPFYIGENNPEMLAFVSAVAFTGGDDDADSRLAEVSYSYDDTEKTFQRKIVQEDDGADWDFYGKTGDSWLGSPENEGSGFHPVIEGVEDITFYNASGDEMDSEGIRTSLPSIVQVSITLFDPSLVDLLDEFDEDTQEQMIERTKRTFNKMIYLRAQGY